MGIPAIRHPEPQSPPEGYQIARETRKLHEGDLIWNTRTGEWMEQPEWIEGAPITDEFYGIAEVKEE